MTTSLFLWVFLSFFVLEFLVNWYLDILNQKEIKANQNIPDFFKNSMSGAEYQQSREYTLTNIKFGKWQRVISSALSLAVLFSGILPALNHTLNGLELNPLLTGVLFFFILMGGLSLLKIPLDLYHTFGIESKYGFNKLTPKLYITDFLKSTLLAIIIGGPFLYLALWFIQSSGSLWWLWLFLFMASFQLVMMVLYPIVLAPLFNKFKPLEEGDLKDGLKSLADKIQFPNNDIFVMDGSKRSGHSNAYFTGFGKMRRIVLFDTLIEQMSTEELKGVLCHEMGHYKKGHIYSMLITSLGIQFVGLLLFSLVINWQPLYTSFGFTEHPSELRHVGLFLFTTVLSTFTFLLGPLMNHKSRVHEFEADAFSVDNIEEKPAMESALIKLAKKNLSNLTPHPWYSAFHYSHPTIYERINAIRARLKQT